MSIMQAISLRALNVLRYDLPQLHACEPLIPRILSEDMLAIQSPDSEQYTWTPHLIMQTQRIDQVEIPGHI